MNNLSVLNRIVVVVVAALNELRIPRRLFLFSRSLSVPFVNCLRRIQWNIILAQQNKTNVSRHEYVFTQLANRPTATAVRIYIPQKVRMFKFNLVLLLLLVVIVFADMPAPQKKNEFNKFEKILALRVSIRVCKQ